MPFDTFRRCGAMAAALAFGLAAQATAQTPQRGGAVVVPIHVGEPPTYDCHGTNSPAAMWRVAPHYSTLLKIDADRFPEVTGDLAKSWTTSPDQLSYRFTLHPNVKFHDGTALTSNDVKVSFDRLRNPPPGVISLRQAMLADIDTIDTPDDTTVATTRRSPGRSRRTVCSRGAWRSATCGSSSSITKDGIITAGCRAVFATSARRRIRRARRWSRI